MATFTGVVLEAVRDEREKQDRKWGEQNHDPARYFAILAEEVGEVAKEVVEYTFLEVSSKLPQDLPSVIAEQEKRLMEELVQTAAVAIAMVECILRRKYKEGVTRETGNLPG